MNTRILSFVAALLMLWLTAACAPLLRAQEPRGGSPTPRECHVLANKLGSNPHSEAFRQALAGPLAACGEIGARAIATALRVVRTVEDSAITYPLIFNVSHNRSPIILDAVLNVAEDRSATVPVRVAALIGALRQHRVASTFGGTPRDLATRPMGRLCYIVSVDHARYLSEAPMPAGYEQTILASMRRIADDGGSPTVVRDLARCVADVIQPPVID